MDSDVTIPLSELLSLMLTREEILAATAPERVIHAIHDGNRYLRFWYGGVENGPEPELKIMTIGSREYINVNPFSLFA